MAFFQSGRCPIWAPPWRRLSLPSTRIVLRRMAVFWKRAFTAYLISILVALGATLSTYWLCFSARAVPFSVTRTDLTMRRGSRIKLFLETGGELAERAIGDEDFVAEQELLGVDQVAGDGDEVRMVPRGEV